MPWQPRGHHTVRADKDEDAPQKEEEEKEEEGYFYNFSSETKTASSSSFCSLYNSKLIDKKLTWNILKVQEMIISFQKTKL